MKVEKTLREKIQALKPGGKPFLVATEKEQMAAYYQARVLGVKIKVRESISGDGFEVFIKR